MLPALAFVGALAFMILKANANPVPYGPPNPARTIVIGIDLSSSNPLIRDDHFAAKVAYRIRGQIESLPPRSRVILRSFGSYNSQANAPLSLDVTIAPKTARAEAKLRHGEAYHRTLIENGFDGIAVVDLRCFTVYDRSGPQLFVVNEAPDELWGHPDGWLSLRGGTLTCWSRTGERSHDVAIGDRVAAHDLVVLRDGSVVLLWAAAGDPLALQACRVAGGTMKWQVEVPDVKANPRYRVAAARSVGDRVFVVGPSSGGTVMLGMDVADGAYEEIARVPFR